MRFPRALPSIMRTTLAMVAGCALLRCSLLVDTSGFAGTPSDAGGTTTDATAEASAPEASIDSSAADADADAGTSPHGDASVWPVNGHAYLGVGVGIPLSWTNASKAAIARGGHLATITSADENAFVYALIRDRKDLFDDTGRGPWLGGLRVNRDAGNLESWGWVTGETWTYTDWGPGQPDDYNNGESCLHYLPDGNGTNPVWNDAEDNASYVYGYVVEFE